MEESRRTAARPAPSARYVLGFAVRPGHIIQVAEADSLLAGQVLLAQAVALLRINGASDVVVSLIHAATGDVRERVPVPPRAPAASGRDQSPSFAARRRQRAQEDDRRP